eukprot:4350375-Amphidinium_carterae.2
MAVLTQVCQHKTRRSSSVALCGTKGMAANLWQHPPPDLIDHVRSEIFRLLTANAQAVWSASLAALAQVETHADAQHGAPHDARPRRSPSGSSHGA